MTRVSPHNHHQRRYTWRNFFLKEKNVCVKYSQSFISKVGYKRAMSSNFEKATVIREISIILVPNLCTLSYVSTQVRFRNSYRTSLRLVLCPSFSGSFLPSILPDVFMSSLLGYLVYLNLVIPLSEFRITSARQQL
jgi:hypothetical protein